MFAFDFTEAEEVEENILWSTTVLSEEPKLDAEVLAVDGVFAIITTFFLSGDSSDFGSSFCILVFRGNCSNIVSFISSRAES